MSRHDIGSEEKKFEELFSALDGISASEELQTRTLDAIFDQMDGLAEADEKPQLVALDGGMKADYRARKRRPSVLPRVAAVILALALASGGVAYALPASYVTITSGETTVEMGINVFGVTVEASADTDGGEQMLSRLNVRGKRYEDAMEIVASGFDERSQGEGEIEVHVRGGIGGHHEAMDEAVDHMMERRTPDAAAPSEQVDGGLDNQDCPLNEGAHDAQEAPSNQGFAQPEQPMGQPIDEQFHQSEDMQAPDGENPAPNEAFQEVGRP